MKKIYDKDSYERMVTVINLFDETIKLNDILHCDACNAMMFISCFELLDSADDLDDAKKTMNDYLDKMQLYRTEVDKYLESN